MNYRKLARALGYCDNKKIITKSKEKLHYKFDNAILKGKQCRGLRQWGIVKQNPTMDHRKMARALLFYNAQKKILKCKEKLHYKFNNAILKGKQCRGLRHS